MGRIRVATFLIFAAILAACGPEEERHQVARPPAAALAPAALPVSPAPEIAHSLDVPATIGTTPVDVFIEQVEKVYGSGMEDYRAGNLESAKEKFNQALSMMLQSDFDLTSDERLTEEFDKLVENVNSVELAALERGDMLAQHKYEAPPIESLAGLTFPVDPRVKERVQQEVKSVQSDLPLVSNDYVDGVITYLQNHARRYMQTVIERRGIYGPMISEALEKQGLPKDLIYLAAGESAFNPLALSRKGALGIWQFMLGTGMLYGLKKNAWVDDREDPFKSTSAAARHLKDLYQTFGDWFLAMAAYDAGPLVVQRAIERTGYADYWKLRSLHALPTETENYVPIFIAIALIAKDPKAYGFEISPDPPLQVDRVPFSQPTDLRLIAQLIDHPVEDVIKLNPSLQRWTTPANDPNFLLNLPAGSKDKLEEALARIPADKRVWWRAHKVEAGETLSEVARKYRISTEALAEANRMNGDDPLETGAHLVLPMAAGSEWSLQRVRQRTSRHLAYYRVKRGDTMELVADRFDTTPYQIRRWNGMRSSQLVVGKTLKVYAPGYGRTSSAHHRTTRHAKSAAGTQYVARRKAPAHRSRHTASARKATASSGHGPQATLADRTAAPAK